MKEITKKIVIFVVIFVILIILFNVLFRFILPIKPVKMTSSSMAPTYKIGDTLFYTSSANYKVNDVILYKSQLSNAVVVRIIEQNSDGTFTVKGDANPIPITSLGQNSITSNQILGKVVFSMNFYLFYILDYGLQILIAVLLTWLFTRKKN